MRGVDTNILVYAHMPAMTQHVTIRSFVEGALAKGETLVVSPLVLHELVHVVTDPRRFDPPLAMAEAVALARLYLRSSNVACVPTTKESMRLTLELLERHRLGRKRVADALLAATLIVHGVPELITTNTRDFAVFDGLRTVDPLG